jgi:predicted RNA-binding Zn-ribbon protein involved in translation (DUF1610 family)
MTCTHDHAKDPRYRCPTADCGWVGTEAEMASDHRWDKDGDERWSKHICPRCGVWHLLSNYIAEPSP